MLDKDQLDAIKKIDNVMIQLELVKELQKQFQSLNVEVHVAVTRWSVLKDTLTFIAHRLYV